ncbi:MAG: hypothetical protein M1829_005239 [Trizodia sp. TS-e1964]|nr:MAG: hypothetical protein M1829_005239 [Trizodia sp. TS-e1964]
MTWTVPSAEVLWLRDELKIGYIGDGKGADSILPQIIAKSRLIVLETGVAVLVNPNVWAGRALFLLVGSSPGPMQACIPSPLHQHAAGVDSASILKDDFSEFRSGYSDEIRSLAAFQKVCRVVQVSALEGRAGRFFEAGPAYPAGPFKKPCLLRALVQVATPVSKAVVDPFRIYIKGKQANFGWWHVGEIILGEAPAEPDNLEAKPARGRLA